MRSEGFENIGRFKNDHTSVLELRKWMTQQ